LSNFELRVPHLAIPSVESCTGSARHGDFWQLKPLNGSLSQWHTTPNSNLDEALVEPHSDSHATRPTPNPSANRPLRFIAKLSAGTALPQTLPTGTAMGMSVDYVLQGELPASAAATVWVIESAQGEQAIPVQLNAKGNLMTFVNMRPEHGPFRSYLAVVYSDGRKVPISRKIDMRSP
jgi:hypothetical protein